MAKRNEFNLNKALYLKREGQNKAKIKALDWVLVCRSEAIKIAKLFGEVTTDDVQKIHPRPKSVHPNATASICKCRSLVFTGNRIKSERVLRHGADIRVYEYRY